ncbi:MAG: MltA domain-containing protein [Pseudomonadota bacterium]
MNNKRVLQQLTKILIILMLFFFCGCFPGIREEITQFNSLKKIRAANYPLFMDTLDFQGFEASIDYSLEYFKRVPLDRKYQYGKQMYSSAHLIVSLETMKAYLKTHPSTKDLNKFIKSRYLVYESVGNEDEQVLFTGYYEPTYDGSLVRTVEYMYPLYSYPDDLLEIDLSVFSDTYKGHKRLKAMVDESTKRVVPYYSRKQINNIKDFHLRSEPIAWLKNRVDRFFLEIQGSGRVRLSENEEIQVHYASSNGNAYQSVGRYLIEKQEILKQDMSMQAIRNWLEQNPDRMDEVLHHNDSFVFFQKEEDGPVGSLGVKVTPFRSIATDSGLFPKGALCFMQTRLPDKISLQPLIEWENASIFVMNQDTGGAIQGPARADLFCGNGAYAEFTAGHKNIYGRLFFLILDPDQP